MNVSYIKLKDFFYQDSIISDIDNISSYDFSGNYEKLYDNIKNVDTVFYSKVLVMIVLALSYNFLYSSLRFFIVSGFGFL